MNADDVRAARGGEHGRCHAAAEALARRRAVERRKEGFAARPNDDDAFTLKTREPGEQREGLPRVLGEAEPRIEIHFRRLHAGGDRALFGAAPFAAHFFDDICVAAIRIDREACHARRGTARVHDDERRLVLGARSRQITVGQTGYVVDQVSAETERVPRDLRAGRVHRDERARAERVPQRGLEARDLLARGDRSRAWPR